MAGASQDSKGREGMKEGLWFEKSRPLHQLKKKVECVGYRAEAPRVESGKQPLGEMISNVVVNVPWSCGHDLRACAIESIETLCQVVRDSWFLGNFPIRFYPVHCPVIGFKDCYIFLKIHNVLPCISLFQKESTLVACAI
jgi:hypothetical protein